MNDGININNVDRFINGVQEIEISDISKIIKQMILIKNSNYKLNKKKTKSYSINDKVNLNKMSYNVSSRIERYHIESYDIIDEAISCIAEFDASIRGDLYDYYYETYIQVLTELDISGDDFEEIKDNADNIYNTMLSNIKNEIFDGKKSEIPINRQITYIGAITAYVFYKCKFLIPVEIESEL